MLENNFFEKNISKAILSFLMLIMLFLTACGGFVPQPQDINYFEGTKGIEIEFLENGPPRELYENATFNVNLMLENKGAYDVVYDQYGILSISYDPFYIDLTYVPNQPEIIQTDNGLMFRGI